MILLWVVIGVLGRVIIHVPDATPTTALCLLAPTFFSRRTVFFIIFALLLLSDISLHFLFHYPLFGSWSFFEYSGWLSVIFVGFALKRKTTYRRGVLFTLLSALLFWLWTNLGTWTTTHLYAHTASGLLQCYVSALPFLRNSVISGLLSISVLWLFFSDNLIHRYIPWVRHNPFYSLKSIRKTD